MILMRQVSEATMVNLYLATLLIYYEFYLYNVYMPLTLADKINGYIQEKKYTFGVSTLVLMLNKLSLNNLLIGGVGGVSKPKIFRDSDKVDGQALTCPSQRVFQSSERNI